MFASLSPKAQPDAHEARWDTSQITLEIVVADLEALVCNQANHAFAAVLQQFPSLPLAVRVENQSITSAVSLTARPPTAPPGSYMHVSQNCASLLGADAEDDDMYPPSREQCQLCNHVEAQDDAATFVVFGGNSAGCASGNLQHAVADAFPEQFRGIELNIQSGLGEDWDGCSWPHDASGKITCSDGHNGVWLISCVTFPRDACSEQHHTRNGIP